MMSERTKKILNEIDTFLSEGTEDSKQLWRVLSALRGPDAGQVNKYTSTSIIRTHALPKTYKASMGLWHPIGASFAPKEMVVCRMKDLYSHFASHIHMAAAVLGLKVEKQK